MAFATLAVDASDLEIVATAPVETRTGTGWSARSPAPWGPTRLRVVDEATTAAVGSSARMSPGDVFCVVDFGAGTLDVCVVRVADPDDRAGAGVRVIAKAGLDLGGRLTTLAWSGPAEPARPELLRAAFSRPATGGLAGTVRVVVIGGGVLLILLIALIVFVVRGTFGKDD